MGTMGNGHGRVARKAGDLGIHQNSWENHGKNGKVMEIYGGFVMGKSWENHGKNG